MPVDFGEQADALMRSLWGERPDWPLAATVWDAVRFKVSEALMRSYRQGQLVMRHEAAGVACPRCRAGEQPLMYILPDQNVEEYRHGPEPGAVCLADAIRKATV